MDISDVNNTALRSMRTAADQTQLHPIDLKTGKATPLGWLLTAAPGGHGD